MAEQQPVKKRPRHLMDPDNPVRMAPHNDRNLTRVQRTVMSVLVGTTIFHLAGGLVIAAIFVDADRTDAQVGLLIIAAIVGILGVVAALVIHQKKPVSPLLLIGVIPSVVGAWWIFR